MTPYSCQPVPDRSISRLSRSQSGTSGKRVKDLSLSAIQTSCTLFHPLHCLSLPLFSLWSSVSFFFFTYIPLASLFTSPGAVIQSFASFLRLKFFSFNFSLHPTILNFMFSPYFPSLPTWDRSFSLTGELHKWHWRRVSVRLHVYSAMCV